ncbi:MAG: TIGR04283 family arsenosugar biosynthesis glycosyltransferase [Caulobacteraceae bacterium]|nr:TIGR04283 family arsenosugar biosynthesis glycosyltransferase [Caulobacter sp.]
MAEQRPAPPLDPAGVAVIVPVLNEATRLAGLLDDLAARGFGRIVVADGGSTDGSLEVAASRPGVALVRAPPGRAAQQSAGAAAAPSARVLLFLHADTRLPPDAFARMGEVLAAGVCAGAFRLRFDRRHPLLDLYAAVSAVESYWTTFGDQAIFARREAFETVGGFPPWPLLEDVALRRALKRHGGFSKSRAAVTTSARRFEAEGVLRRQLKNGAILLLHALGAPASRLAGWYR